MPRRVPQMIAAAAAAAAGGALVLAAAGPAAAKASNSASAKHVGVTLTLNGPAKSKAKVTLVKVIDPAHIIGSAAPGANARFVAVKFKLTSLGLNPFPSADAVLNVTVSGSNKQTYLAETSSAYESNVSGCTNFIHLKAALFHGHSMTGCINFTLPTGVAVALVTYSPPGGTKGQWNVP